MERKNQIILLGLKKKLFKWAKIFKSKSIWVSLLLPKWYTHGGITLAKGQLGHSYTFWTIPVMIFSPVSNFGDQSLVIWGHSITTWTKFRLFLTTYLPLRGHFLHWTQTINWLSWTTSPPHFVYVVIEQPQSLVLWKSLRNRNIKVNSCLEYHSRAHQAFLNVMAH